MEPSSSVGCPHCGKTISLADALAGPAIEERLATERQRIAQEEAHRAKLAHDHLVASMTNEKTALAEALKAREDALKAAQQEQLTLMQRQRELVDAQNALELTVQQRVQADLATATATAKERALQEFELKAQQQRREFELLQQQNASLEAKASALLAAEQTIHRLTQQAEQAQRATEAQLTERLATERQRIVQEEAHRAKLAHDHTVATMTNEKAALAEALKAREDALKAAQQEQLTLMQRQRELVDAQNALELTVQQRVQADLATATATAKERALQEFELKAQQQRREFELLQQQNASLEAKASALLAAEQTIHRLTQQAEQAQRATEAQLTERLATERQRIAQEEAHRAKLAHDHLVASMTNEKTALAEALKAREDALKAAQQEQLTLMQRQRELVDAQNALELTVQQRVQADLATATATAKERALQEFELKAQQQRREFELLQQQNASLEAKASALLAAEQTIHRLTQQAEQAQRATEAQLTERLATERQRIVQEEAHRAKLAHDHTVATMTNEKAALTEALKARDDALKAAQQEQLALMQRQRQLDDEKREMELTLEKKLQAELASHRDAAKREATEQLSIKLAEKEEMIRSLSDNINRLKEKAEQGSMQAQGEANEQYLESLLRSSFQDDDFSPVQTGQRGSDLLQRVVHERHPTGTLVWEFKRTKTWSDSWITKVKSDMREANADIAIIASHALPKHVETFDIIDGVWIVHPRVCVEAARIARQTLIEIGRVQTKNNDIKSKSEQVYEYLTGHRFKARVETMLEAFKAMQEDLDKERKMLTKQWAKREAQLSQVVCATTGMYGDLQAIAGRTLLELPEIGLIDDEAPPQAPRGSSATLGGEPQKSIATR